MGIYIYSLIFYKYLSTTLPSSSVHKLLLNPTIIDNLINFHRWKSWKNISQKCNILVFDRYPYKSKALKSLAFKQIDKEKLKFINFKKVNISSSQLRKI